MSFWLTKVCIGMLCFHRVGDTCNMYSTFLSYDNFSSMSIVFFLLLEWFLAHKGQYNENLLFTKLLTVLVGSAADVYPRSSRILPKAYGLVPFVGD